MPAVGFEPTISTREQPKTCVLDRAATGTGRSKHVGLYNRQDPVVFGQILSKFL